jgi:hypothetical protein
MECPECGHLTSERDVRMQIYTARARLLALTEQDQYAYPRLRTLVLVAKSDLDAAEARLQRHQAEHTKAHRGAV